MKIKTQFRQGDVLIQRVEQLPVDAKPDKGRVILAHGEVTGHAHEIAMDAAEAWKLDGQTVALALNKNASVTHQEHASIPLTPGTYLVTRQREYSPEAIRNVAD